MKPSYQLTQLKALVEQPAFQRLAARCLMLEAFAAQTRQFVWKYLEPVFAQFDFRVSARMDSENSGQRITDPQELYLCLDDALCHAYYAAADEAHRQAGYRLPTGYSPVLVAENGHERAVTELLACFDAHMGTPGVMAETYGQHRKDAQRLVIGAALQHPRTARLSQLMLPRNSNALLCHLLNHA